MCVCVCVSASSRAILCWPLLKRPPQHTARHCKTLQDTAAHCNTMQHTATHCNTLQNKVCEFVSSMILCWPLLKKPPQHTATHNNTLQHAATCCDTLQHAATHCNILQYTATYCNTLQQCVRVRELNDSVVALAKTAREIVGLVLQQRTIFAKEPCFCKRALLSWGTFCKQALFSQRACLQKVSHKSRVLLHK